MFFEIRIERFGPMGEHDSVAALVGGQVMMVTQPVPQFLGNERQERMEQPQRVRQNEIDHGESVGAAGLSFACSSRPEEALTIFGLRTAGFGFFGLSLVTPVATC